MAPFRLPVSGLEVLFRQPAGAEDILLAEAPALDTRLALALAGALGRLAGGGAVAWEKLAITDLDAALLAIRRLTIGGHIRSSVVCGGRRSSPEGGPAGCGARIDVAFHVDDYLAHHAPRRPRGVAPAAEPGWFCLEGTEVTFRLPSCADQIALADHPHVEKELGRRCLRPEAVPPRLRRRTEAAMEALAPSLYGDLDGRCPECSATVLIAFDPQRYVLSELRARAAFVYEEIHLIAGHYRWSEQEILALPRERRARYADLVHATRAVS